MAVTAEPETSIDGNGRTTKLPRSRFWYPYVLIAPALGTLMLVSLIPFLYAAYLSFHEMNYAQMGDWAGFSNYASLLGDARFWHSVKVAVIFVAIAVPVEFMLGLSGALILNQGIRFRRAIVPLMFIPTMMAPIVVGLLWKIMLAGSWGLISYNVLERFGLLTGTSVFASSELALYALILIDVWQWTPFLLLAFFAGLQALPLNPFRAAAVDGATPAQSFFRITLPLLTPLIAVMVLIRLIDAFKVFETIFILTAGGPGTATETPGIFGYKLVFEFWKLGEATALAVVIWLLFFIFCNIFYFVAKKQLKAF